MNPEIAYCMTYPGVGIARLGNSPEDFFIGPEVPGLSVPPEGGYKDALGRIKRQAARFHVYGFNANDEVVKELTADDADITWLVRMANTKADYLKFRGRFKDPTSRERRNPETRERGRLKIEPGDQTITGRNQFTAPFGGYFRPTPKRALSRDAYVVLGELRTDSDGRLLILGGLGKSGSTIRDNPIMNYANNDCWYDDTSDGCVTAAVVLKEGNRLIPLRTGSWVIAAPPKFAPALQSIVTLYDVMEEVAIDRGDIVRPNDVSFTRDVYPILVRVANYQWVNDDSNRGHGPGAKGDFLAPDVLTQLADKGPTSSNRRKKILAMLRNPRLDLKSVGARKQAYDNYMPQLAGDGGDPTDGQAETWMRILKRQYEIMKKWADGNFVSDWKGMPRHRTWKELNVAEQPGALDRAALEPCIGGPFYPGIEATYITQYGPNGGRPNIYSGAFRFDKSKLNPGDVTHHMALPWQADFYECQQHWWPTQRPDDVVTEAEYQEIARGLQSGESTNRVPTHERLAALLAYRERWDRGLRPNPEDDSGPHLGDMDMVQMWSQMGFVVPRMAPNHEIAQVETERDPYTGMNVRDFFYRMMNIEAFPDFLPKARALVENFLDEAWAKRDLPENRDHLSFFPYSQPVFDARLNSIYNDLAHEAEQYNPATDEQWRTYSDVVERIRQFAPFNQADGSWIRNVAQGGPIDEVRSLLFSIWSDEVGNGDVAHNHCNLYTNLLADVDIYLPPTNSPAYAQNPDMLDSAFTVPLFELAISQFSNDYFPEILGMTLQLEWEVLDLKRTIKLLRYFGLNPHFYELHVGIDNAANGHGARARRAIQIYLDQIRQKDGDAEMQRIWRRIWRGYVAFALTGDLGADLRMLLAQRGSDQPSLRAQVTSMIERKRPYAQLNHGSKMLGPNTINDWFKEPDAFLDELLHSKLIIAGDPERSPFFKLIDFDGPMFEVFSGDEIELWRNWTISLTATNGTNPTARKPLDVGQQMLRVIDVMRQRQRGNSGHRANLRGVDPDHEGRLITQPIHWWFEQTDGRFLMSALANEDNGWVIQGDSANSPIVTKMIGGTSEMARALREIAPGTVGMTYAEIVELLGHGPATDLPPDLPSNQGLTYAEVFAIWIDKRCPIPGVAARRRPAVAPKTLVVVPAPEQPLVVIEPPRPAVHMRSSGMRAVH